MSTLTLTNNKVATFTLTSNTSTITFEIKKVSMVLSSSGTKGATGATGEGFEASEVSYGLFERAGIASKDDNLFPDLITKSDYNGITSATQVINRNISNNLIIDSVIDTYDYLSLHYVWTTPYLGGTDLLANRHGTPSVVIT